MKKEKIYRKITKNYFILFCDLLFLFFLYEKLAKHAEISWFIVFSPVIFCYIVTMIKDIKKNI
jgi:hypothetical protein